MPLPVAVGGRAVSAETLPRANCREEDSDDGIPLMPVELYQTIGWGVCPQNEWLIRVTAGYYDLMDFNKGGRDCTMCELRIQVSLLAKPLSSHYRETVHHLKLVDGARDDYPQFQPQVAVSQDRRNLAVLLFHPHQQSSAVVMFQIRKPRTDLTPKTNIPNSATPLPMPTYCNKISHRRNAPAVATNPSFVSVWGISAICSIPNIVPSVFLAACNDGSLIWLDARSSTTIATGALAIASKDLPISSLSVSAEGLERGRILAVSSATGHCILAQWKLESSTAVQQTQLERNSTGDLVSLSRQSTSQEKNQADGQNGITQNHDFAESFILEETTTKITGNKSHSNSFSVTKRKTTNQASAEKKIESDKDESHQALQRRSSKTNEPRDGIQNALKGLKSNRFWSTLAAKNLSTPSNGSAKIEANITTSKKSTVNGQHTNWKSAFHEKNSSPEKESNDEVLREQREKEAGQARRQRGHMNQFVLQELRKKTMAKSWVKQASGMGSGRGASLQRRRRRSDVAGRQEDPLRSTMDVSLLSVLQQSVVAARFATLPTVVCVVYQAARKHPQVAQMFSITEMGTLQPIVSLHLTPEQVEEATSLQSTNAIVSDEDWDVQNSVTTKFGLDLDVKSDTFAISTAFGDQWIGCLWNWRTNALGLVVQNEANSSLWSRLYFGREKQAGLKLCYLETCIQDLRIQTHKHLLSAGMLSPPHSHAMELEPCPLFLAADFVAFPYFSHETNNGAQQLEWKSSTLPLSYVNAYGAPKLAAVGRHNAATIAIASSLGVCLLDSKYRWRQFGTPIEESSFSIVSMVWWEANGTKKTEDNEDLLLTIIQLKSGKQYLSCWSPKRLSTSHQLLVFSSPDTGTRSKWGIPLIEDVKVSSLTLLAEPSSKIDGAQRSRKAVVFVASTDAEASELTYACFRLQLASTTNSGSEKRRISVLTSETVSGTLKDGTRSIGPISSIFLAGASFRFDLQDNCTATLPNSLVATIGVVRSPGGLEVISYDASNKACTSTIVHADEVSKISLVDIAHGVNRRADTFVWAIELLNGDMFCWSVPSLLGPATDEGIDFYSLPTSRNDTIKPSILHPPMRVCTRDRRSKIMRYAMGVLSNAGASSDWMQQSAFGCQSDIFVGPIPRSSYGCGLRVGQRCRRKRRAGLNGSSDDKFTANINFSELYGPGNFMITPPAFIPSLYSMLVETAHRMAQSDDMKVSQELEDHDARILSIERHMHNRLTTNQNKDAVTMAIRLFVLRTVEMVADVNKRQEKAPTDASLSSLLLATNVLSEIIESVRKCATELQFASLLLEVGRQMEPSCLPHLFPLPLPKTSPSPSPLSIGGAKSVADLFGICMQEGSLMASASALPLLGSRMQSRYRCLVLMTRALASFISNTSSNDTAYDGTEEERIIMGDIFRFGIKLENAARLESHLKDDQGEGDTGEQNALHPISNEKVDDDANSLLSENASNSSASDFSDDSSHVTDTRKLLCSGERQHHVINVFSIFDHESREEQEIRKSALSFIGVTSGLEVDCLSTDDGGNTSLEESYNDFDSNVMVGLVGNALVELILSPQTDCPWKAMASIARILGQDNGDDCDDGVAIFVKVAGNLGGTEIDNMIPDLHPDLRAGDVMDRFTEFLVTETGHCGTEITSEDADLIVDLVLQLLQFLEGANLSKEGSSILPGLVMVGLVASSVAGCEQRLLSTLRHDCFVSECYKVTAYDC